MARAAPPRPTDAANAGAALPFAEWLDSQQRLAAVAADQWAGLQELWLRGLHQQLDTWNAWWRPADSTEPAAAAWSEVPAAWTAAVQRAAEAWWGPWLPLLARGGEQLG